MEATRSDAERNRGRILDAARSAVEHGDALALNAVARAAGVGVATVYRHFTSVEALQEAVVGDRFHELRAQMDDVEGDTGFGDLLERYYGLLVSDPLFAAVTSRPEPALEQTVAVREELIHALGALMRTEADAGRLSPDLSAAELLALLCGLAHSARTLQVTAESAHGRRLFAVLRAGITAVR